MDDPAADPRSPPPLDRFWAAASASASPHIDAIRSRLPAFSSAPLRIQRVSQLDAELLDGELLTLLLDPLKASLAQVRSTLPTFLEPELVALLRLVLFKYSIWDKGASYGAMLQNLRYRNEWAHRSGRASGLQSSTFLAAPLSNTQLALYPLLTIALPYARQRLERYITGSSFSHVAADDPRRRIPTLVDALERTYDACALANFLAFLSNGKYRTLADRLLGMRLTYAQRTLNRAVSFEFLNRQLVWHAFTEFLLFLLPLLRPRRLLRTLLRLPTHPRLLAIYLALLPTWLSRALGVYRDARGTPRYRRPALRLRARKGDASPLSSSSSSSSSSSFPSSQTPRPGPYAHLPPGICALCWSRIEADNASSAFASLGGGGGGSGSGGAAGDAAGIPTSDPLDPSSRPSSAAHTHSASSTAQRIQRYHQSSSPVLRAKFGVDKQSGIPYAAAVVHVPYRAVGCRAVSAASAASAANGANGAGTPSRAKGAGGAKAKHPQPPTHPQPQPHPCTYCYVCLARVLLSEEAGERLEDGGGGGGGGGGEGEGESGSAGPGAWDCLRCGGAVSGMRRVEGEEGDGDVDGDDNGQGGDEDAGEGPPPYAAAAAAAAVAGDGEEEDGAEAQGEDDAELDLGDLR